MTNDKLTVESVSAELQSAVKWFGEHGKNTNTGVIAICQHAIDLINRLDKKTSDLEYTLMGVMHSVDKWLEGDELNQHEVNRAATMREKTLQIVERQQKEIENARAEIATEYADKLQRYILDNCCITSDDVDGIWKQINEIVKGHTESQTEQ